MKLLAALAMATVLGGCSLDTTFHLPSPVGGSIFGSNSLPSCSNVRGYNNYSTPLGAEHVGSRLWVERRVIYTSQVGGRVRAVAAHRANGTWQGEWQTSVRYGGYDYDVNFHVRAEETNYNTKRLERRHVEVDLHIFGPQMGAYGRQHTVRMVALKYQGAPDTDWAICPSRY